MRVILIAIIFAAGLSAKANAQQTRLKLFDICKFDIEQYCKGYTKKQGKQVKECLQKQERNLLPYCQDRYKKAN